MLIRPQCACSRRIYKGPMLQPVRMSRHHSLSRPSYALWSSRKILQRTASLIAIICCIILDLREAVPFPWTAQKPWRVSCKTITAARFRLKITVYFFHRTSKRPTPQKSPPPFGIITTICQVQYSPKIPFSKSLLYQGDNLPPVLCVWGILPSLFLESRGEVLFLNY